MLFLSSNLANNAVRSKRHSAALIAETAINIGYSCRLLKEEMEEVYIVDGDTATEVRRQLQDAANDMEEKRKDEMDGMPSTMQQQQQGRSDGVGMWRRNRVDVAASPAVGADLLGFALVINGCSLVSLGCSEQTTLT